MDIINSNRPDQGMENRNETCSRSVTKCSTESLCGCCVRDSDSGRRAGCSSETEGQQEAEVEVQAPSAVLMEASTGAVVDMKKMQIQDARRPVSRRS